MKRIALTVAAALTVASHAHFAHAQQSHMTLVTLAVTAQGGEPALRALKALTVTGDAKNWEPEQSLVPGGPPRYLGESAFTTTMDLVNGLTRTDWDRAMQYPAVQQLKLSEVLTPKFGFVIDAKGSRAMSGIRVATELRELERASPTLLLKLLDNPKNVAAEGAIRVGNELIPAVTLRDGPTAFTIMFDRKTHLPSIIRTHDDDAVHGDADFDLILADWKPVAGVMVAHSLSYKLDDVMLAKFVYKTATANPAIAADLFAADDAVKAAAKPPATGTVPYQWVMRRIALGAFLDSDGIFVPPGGSLKLVELAPNVQQVVGGSHNSLIVAMKDALAVFDAPINEAQSRWTIDAAKAKYPGKPIKYLVLTHHHGDHVGGLRTYVAEGATVVVPNPARTYIAKIAIQQHTLVPDELQVRHKSPEVVEVKDQMPLTDDQEDIRLYRVVNPHAAGMLIAHLVKENIVWVTDLWSPGRETTRTQESQSFLEALKQHGITGALIAGGHGAARKQSDLEQMFASQ